MVQASGWVDRVSQQGGKKMRGEARAERGECGLVTVHAQCTFMRVSNSCVSAGSSLPHSALWSCVHPHITLEFNRGAKMGGGRKLVTWKNTEFIQYFKDPRLN